MSKIKIDVKKDVTGVLPFLPFPEFGNLCLGYLTEVNVDESEAKESQWEYSQEMIPKLTFVFSQHKLKEGDKERAFYHTELPIASIKVSGEEITPENLVLMYTELWKRVKHIHDQYLSSANYKEIKTVPEFDPDTSVAERLATFKKFFAQIADSFNKGKDKETPIYTPHGSNGTKRENLLAMKLIAGGKNNTRLVFPNFVGTGFVEKATFKGPKLDSILIFRASETITLGGGGTAVAGVPGAQTEISNTIANELLS